MGAGVGGQTVSRLFFAGISQANPKRSSRIAGKEEVELGGSWVGGKTGCSYPPRAFIAAHLARQRAWKVLLVLWPGAQISFGILHSCETVMGFRIINLLSSCLLFLACRGRETVMHMRAHRPCVLRPRYKCQMGFFGRPRKRLMGLIFSSIGRGFVFTVDPFLTIIMRNLNFRQLIY
jgi:hypothetical protein